MSRCLTVLATGPLTTVQDAGRPGQGALGIGRSGACDRAAAALANRLVGNPPDAAVLESTLGGLAVRAGADLLVVTTGARCAGSPAHNAPLRLAAGAELRLGPPGSGLRTYLAVRGGIAVPPVLGSRSTDLLSGLGPPVVAAGDELPVGDAAGELPGVDLAPVPEPPGGEVTVQVLPGPRADWFPEAAAAALTGTAWTVTGESNRIGLRLDGAPLERARAGELASEGMVRGALQVPASGLPVLFLADAPVTGGYPVIGYVADPDVDRCAQLRPGQTLRFRGTVRAG
ncbi:biotin-dependent carboxyltransferase family protein [Geodermatophilus sp. CPCC 206100]|uniref:5-oxoprolinase subunit C family protein n=1 Tax=Geodermatophilus sp. CPCC 206100 TaxID=3020054 RepID=UPI003B006703